MSAADVVVDVGNSRVKWGRCGPQSITDSASLPADAPAAWGEQLARHMLAEAGFAAVEVTPAPDRLNNCFWCRG